MACVAIALAEAQDWTEIRRLYYQAVDGDHAAAERAATLMEGARATQSNSPLFLAYCGSLTLLESSRSMAPWRKGKLAKQGLEMMDRAIAAAPDDLEIRFLRAASTMGLPGFFHRSAESASDFAHLAPHVPDAVRSGKLEPRLGSAALHYHALNREKAHDRAGALRACRDAVRIAPNTPAAHACLKRFPAN